MTKPITHELSLNPDLYQQIRAGTKTIEMRLYDDKRRTMQVGDELIFLKRPELTESLTCTIKALYRFPDFATMCSTLPLAAMGYEGDKLKAWLERRDHGMSPYYSAAEEAQNGVIGIELELKRL